MQRSTRSPNFLDRQRKNMSCASSEWPDISQVLPVFSAVTEPLTQLLQHPIRLDGTVSTSFREAKSDVNLQSAPVLSAPDFNRPFKIAVEASDVAAGAVLLQEDRDGVDHPVCYFSRKFNQSQQNYPIVEKECLAVILALTHFEVYVSSTMTPLVIYSDHNPLVFLHKLKNNNQRLLRY